MLAFAMMLIFSLKEVLFKRPFYQVPVLLLSPRQDHYEGKLGTVNPEYNAITTWVEVSLFKQRKICLFHVNCWRALDETAAYSLQ